MATTFEIEPRKTPATPLLRLPPVIRHRIYRFLGLASWNGSPYNFDLNGPRLQVSIFRWSREEQNPNEFHGILITCRDLHAETAALLYSANRFVLRYTTPGSLRPLFALTTTALTSLTALKVVLNQTSCHQQIQNHDGEDCCLYKGGWHLNTTIPTCERQFHSRHHQPPLLSPAAEGNDNLLSTAQALLGEWHAAASHLSPYLTPNRLELSLVCDIDPQHGKTVEIAKAALEPVRVLPLLRSCHIRLCKTPDPRLHQLAQDGALQSNGILAPYMKPPSAKSTFTILPRELRLRILEFTDLVTPNKEVWWSRDECRYMWWDLGGGGDCLDMWSHCHFNACWHRTNTQIRVHGGSSIGCFCHRRHAAFSATCTCWAAPGPALFLVCRTWYRDAQLVFFSTNRFIVHDFTMFTPWSIPEIPYWHRSSSGVARVDYPYERIAASQFLREVIPGHCIPHLRFLELVFPPYLPYTWPQTDHPAMRDWRETVSWVRDKISGPAFTLRLIVIRYSNDSSTENPIITVAEGDMVHEAYMHLLQPLKGLVEGANGLSRFYASLGHPWERTVENENRRTGKEDLIATSWLQAEERALKERAERLVMGDRYEKLYANGKEEPQQSLWKHVLRRHL